MAPDSQKIERAIGILAKSEQADALNRILRWHVFSFFYMGVFVFDWGAKSFLYLLGFTKSIMFINKWKIKVF